MNEIIISDKKLMQQEYKQNYVYKARNQMVVMANDLIQKFRNELNTTDQKVLSFIISLIKPRTDNDKELRKEYPLEYVFSMQDYFAITGMADGGRTYQDIKASLKRLSENKWWAIYDGSQTVDGEKLESVVGWLDRVRIHPKTKKVYVRIHEEVAPYLFDLAKNFTEYELIYILSLPSSYSIRLYQLLKSWANMGGHTYTVDEFREVMNIQNIKTYASFGKIREKIIVPSLEIINKKTDIRVEYITHNKRGSKAIEKIEFVVKKYNEDEEKLRKCLINDELDGTDTYGEQLSLFNDLGHMKRIEEMLTESEW